MQRFSVKIKIVFSAITLVVIGLVFFSVFTFRPIDIKIDRVEYFSLNDAKDSTNRLFEHMQKGFNEMKSSNTTQRQFLSDYDRLPSDNPADFTEVTFFFCVKNKSIVSDYFNLTPAFEDMKSEENRYLFTKLIPETINVATGEENVVLLSAYLYTKGLSDNEIQAIFKGMTVSMTYSFSGLWDRVSSYEIDDVVDCRHNYYYQ